MLIYKRASQVGVSFNAESEKTPIGAIGTTTWPGRTIWQLRETHNQTRKAYARDWNLQSTQCSLDPHQCIPGSHKNTTPTLLNPHTPVICLWLHNSTWGVMYKLHTLDGLLEKTANSTEQSKVTKRFSLPPFQEIFPAPACLCNSKMINHWDF